MIAANASAVFAADCNYSLGADTGSADLSALKPGDVIKFVAKLDSNSGLAYVKNTITFDSDVFERVDYEKENEDGDIETYAVYSSWGSFTVNDAQAGKTIFNWANATNKTGKTVFKIWYKVKENVDNGSYDFDLVCNEAKNASGTAVDIGASKCTVTVTGGNDVVTVDYAALDAAIAAFEAKTEADYTAESWATAKTAYDAAVAAKTATTQAEVDAATTALTTAIAALELKPVVVDKLEVKPDAIQSKVMPNGQLTFGVGGTVEITGTKSFTKLVFALEDTVNSKSAPYTWDFGTAINASVSYGLNITGCPAGSNITATVTAE